MAMTGQAIVRVLGDESKAVASLKRLNAASEASQKQFNRDFGSIAQTAQRTALVAGAAIGAIGFAIHRLNQTYDQFTASNRQLDSAAKLTGTSLSLLSGIAGEARTKFQLAAPQANQLTISLSKLTAKAGDISKTGAAIEAFVNLGAAQGLTVDETLVAVRQAILGIDEGTDKLFQKNPSVLYAEFAAKIGTTAGKLTDQQKAQAIVNAGLEAANRVGGAYNAFLDTAAGKQQTLNNRITDASVALAEAWQPARVTILESLADSVEDLAETIAQNEEGIRSFFDFLMRATVTGSTPNIELGQRAGGSVRRFLSLANEERTRAGSIFGHGPGPAEASDFTALRGGLVRFNDTIGLNGGGNPWMAASQMFNRSSDPLPFPETPDVRAAREKAEAAALKAAEARAAAEKEAEKLWEKIAEMRRNMTPLATPNDPMNPVDPITGTRRSIDGSTMQGVSIRSPFAPGPFQIAMPAGAQRFFDDQRTRQQAEAFERARLANGGSVETQLDLVNAELSRAEDGAQRFADALFQAALHVGDGSSAIRSIIGTLASAGGSSLAGAGLKRITAWIASDALGRQAALQATIAGATAAQAASAGTAASGAAVAAGPAGIALAGAGLALQLLPKLFSSRESEEAQYRAHLRALREARKEEYIFNIVLPDGVLNPVHDPKWRELIHNTQVELGGTRLGRVNVNTGRG